MRLPISGAGVAGLADGVVIEHLVPPGLQSSATSAHLSQ